MAAPPVVRAVRSARRRLFAQALTHRLVAAWTVALAVALVAALAAPLVRFTPSVWTVASLLLAGFVVAVVAAIRRFPSRLAAALELDARFHLTERLTTAVGLSAAERESPVGRAVLADADAHARDLRVRDRFPVRPGRKALRVPLLAGLLAVVGFAYHPLADSGLVASRNPTDAGEPAADPRARTPFDARPKAPALPDRADRSPRVKELQDELARLDAAGRSSDPDVERERVAALTTAEQKAKAFEQEKRDRLARLEQRLGALGKLSAADDFKGGPADKLNAALAAGDLEKAGAAADDLARQVRDPNLDPKAAGKLDAQMGKMSAELRRAARNQDEQDRLTKLIEQGKAEGRDTAALERELERVRADAGKAQDLERMADELDAARKALREGDRAEAARRLDRVGEQVKAVRGEVQDLKEAQGQAQRAGAMKAEATGAGQGSGARPQTPAATQATDERQRAPFDPGGRATPAGPTPGGGFTRTSPTELGPAIDRAARDAPDAVAGQPLSRDDKDAVGEFYRDFPRN